MILPLTKRDYFLIVNHQELEDKAKNLGYDNTIFVSETGLSDNIVNEIRLSEKGISLCLFQYNPMKEEELINKLKNAGIRVGRSSFVDMDEDGIFLTEDDVKTLDEVIQHFPSPDDLEDLLYQRQIIKRHLDDRHCGNCGESIGKDEKYCQYCGCRKGSEKFNPTYADIRIAYGPPVERICRCSSCGHEWVLGGIIYSESEYCPICGKKTVDSNEKILELF